MKVKGQHYRTIWFAPPVVFLIEQNLLPFSFQIVKCADFQATCRAIKNMTVRGAGAIGAAAGFAMAQALLAKVDPLKAKKEIEATRPTAQNLFYAAERVFQAADPVACAQKIADEDAASCQRIGELGSQLIIDGMRIETHCNAGWLAFVDYGTALAPIYAARDQGKNVFVYVDETRPRGQGARLTAWELFNEKIPHAIIPDNAGASLMSQGKVDMVIVGADRIAANGDVANKIGTLEKALAAHEYGIPFYVAAPTATIDLQCASGQDIPIEERSEKEVTHQSGINEEGQNSTILVCSPGSTAYNPAFDVTPAKYITKIITERGVVAAPAALFL
ncbi:S-methyl-5-thioribose-1-phosphate isomerase [Candidatus Saganbacteria bacterium]|nr:S-methyl-5-thioribose-1-phosphate isomerase [Candidatus Saganbacteria bacterium]